MSADARTVFLETLNDLMDVTHANIERSKLIRERISALNKRVGEGTSLAEALSSETSPLTVELITENIKALQELGSAAQMV